MGLGKFGSFIPQTLDMEFDGFFDEIKHFIARFADRYTAREIGHISPKAGGPFFYNDHVSHS